MQPISRQHHDELLSCLLIKKGVNKKADIRLLTDFTNTFWNNDLKTHIEAEENILIPFLIKHKFENRYINMLKTDHAIIKSVHERLNVFDHRHKVFEIFASVVEQHIRFEERVIIGKVEELLTPAQLEELGLKMGAVRYQKCNDYPVKFWE